MTGKYSIWFVPQGEVYEKLSKIITDLSLNHFSPKFEPHVSLMLDVIGTEEDMFSKTSLLASLMQAFSIMISEVGYEEDFFKFLFIKAEPSDELIQANLKAREIFSRQSDPPFMPHLSLMYGKFPKEIKEKIIAEIGSGFDLTFEAEKIYLYTSGDPQEWRRVGEFPLKN